MSTKQLEVTIMGQNYILGCPEGRETALLEAVGQVDREMCTIRDAGRVKARERIAVLTALNLAYALAERGDATLAAVLGPVAPPVAVAPVEPSYPELEALVRRIDAVLDDGVTPA